MIESDHSLTRKPGTNRVTQRIVVENSVVLCGSLDFLRLHFVMADKVSVSSWNLLRVFIP